MSLPQPASGRGRRSSRRSCAPIRPGWPSIRSCTACWTPPERVHGEAWPITWRRCCGRSAHASAPTALLAAGRAAAGLAARVQEAVLALLRSADPAECVSGEMPGILAVDAAHLCVEAEHPGARRLPDGTVARLLDGRQVVFRDDTRRCPPAACRGGRPGAPRCAGARAGRGTAGAAGAAGARPAHGRWTRRRAPAPLGLPRPRRGRGARPLSR